MGTDDFITATCRYRKLTIITLVYISGSLPAHGRAKQYPEPSRLNAGGHVRLKSVYLITFYSSLLTESQETQKYISFVKVYITVSPKSCSEGRSHELVIIKFVN